MLDPNPLDSHPTEEADTPSVVLVVDPNDPTTSRTVSALEEADIPTVETVDTARAAREHLERQPVECIVSEATLPDGTGLGLYESLQEDRPDLPFVVHTADGSEAVASDALSAGVTEYISKERDGSLQQLVDTVERVLQRRNATQALTTAEADEFRALVDGIRDHAIFLLDPEGYVTSWNRGAHNLNGYRREEILGAHVSTFYPEAATERNRPTNLLAEARTHGRVTDEGWQVRKDGSQFWASVVIRALRDDDGAVRGFAKFTRDLTEQRERERQLREQHHLTERILDAVPVAVAVHSPEGDRLRANDRATELLDTLGIDGRDDTGGATAAIRDAAGEPLDPGEFPTERVIATGEPVMDRELAVERPDGSREWLSVSSVPMADRRDQVERIITAGRDITTLKRRERELEETRVELEETIAQLEAANQELERTGNRFEALTKNSSVAVITIDADSTVRFANDTVEEIFGYEPETLVGTSLTRIIPDRLAPDHLQALDRYQTDGTRHLDWDWIEVPGEHRDGHEVQLGLSFGETRVDGDHLFTAVIRDITEQKERQQELEERREELSELVEELERSNAELEQFAYAVSHDMKEPLRMISSYLNLLERRYGGELDEDADEFIQFAVDGADRMQRMIDEILEFSRVDLDESAHEPVDCTAVLAEVREMLAIEEADAEVTVEALPTVRANRTQLTKLFQNLLSNAVAHSEGHVTVDIGVEQAGGRWRFAVADTGPGIPQQRQEHIFDLFTSVGASGGSGVGLALCRKIVQHHGGEITVDSTLGEGTTFTFTLPDAGEHDTAPDSGYREHGDTPTDGT